MHKILVLIEKTEDGFSAYAPDVPGCVAAGKTVEETELLMHGALEMHLADLAARGEELPEQSHVVAEYFMAGGSPSAA